MRNPIMLNRNKPPRGAYLVEAYLRGWLNRDRRLT